jgi:RNA polymerase sigma factor (sigma-70 family)
MPKISSHSDVQWLEGIRNGEEKTIRLIFSLFKPRVVSFLGRNGTSKEEAEDIFMDVLEALFRKSQEDEQNFIDNDKFEPYLRRACLFQWMNRCRRKKLDAKLNADDLAFYGPPDSIEEALTKVEQAALFRKCFAKLGEQCRYILERFLLEREPLQKIAEDMGLTYGYTKKKKYKCNKQLITLIKTHPEYEELKK